MKLQNQNIKSNFFKKIFIKICRKLDFEIIDQGNLHLPVMNKGINNNLSRIGKESLVLPMGRMKITRPVKSLDIILRTCASVNMLQQSKKRLFKSQKSEYSFKTLNSIINSINKNKKIFKKIKLKLTIIDSDSDPIVIKKFKKIADKQFFKFVIINRNLDFYKKKSKKLIRKVMRFQLT